MKAKTFMLYLILMLCGLPLNAQAQIDIDTVTYRYFNGITGKAEIIERYRIANNSEEDYLTWVSLEPINNRTNIELTHDYFKKIKGDFSLIQMMFENILDELPITIGFSFIKNISAGETFSYFIAKNETESNFYRERIVLIKRKEVEQYLRMQIQEKYFYLLSSVLLTEKQSSKQR